MRIQEKCRCVNIAWVDGGKSARFPGVAWARLFLFRFMR